MGEIDNIKGAIGITNEKMDKMISTLKDTNDVIIKLHDRLIALSRQILFSNWINAITIILMIVMLWLMRNT